MEKFRMVVQAILHIPLQMATNVYNKIQLWKGLVYYRYESVVKCNVSSVGPSLERNMDNTLMKGLRSKR